MTHSTVRLFADTLGKYTQCEVLLPDRPEPGRPVPALYLLHGLSDDQSIWMRRTAIELRRSPWKQPRCRPAHRART